MQAAVVLICIIHNVAACRRPGPLAGVVCGWTCVSPVTIANHFDVAVQYQRHDVTLHTTVRCVGARGRYRAAGGYIRPFLTVFRHL